MRFMVIIKANEDSEAGVMPPTEVLEQMGAYNQRLMDAGVLLAGEGLHPTSRAVRVHFQATSAPSSTARSPRPRS